MIHKDVNFTRRLDLSNHQEAHLTVAVHLSKTKKILIHSWYRQWQEIENGKKVPATGTVKAQKERISKTAACFLKSKAEAETIVMSDTNVNTERLQVPESLKTSRDKQTSQVARILSTSILQEGFTATNSAPTHKTSVIDHIFTSNPIKISNIATRETHMSDHKLVTAIIITKDPTRKPRFTSSRQYSNIDYTDMCEAINLDPRLQQVMASSDTNYIATNIIQVIRDQLDERAPKRRIQVTNRKTNPSNSTKELIIKRDHQAYMEYCNQPTLDNHRGYKNLKTQTKKALIEDKSNQDKRKMQDATTSKDQWKEAKILIGWMAYGGPQMIIKDGQQVTSPQKMANHLNMDYITRAAKAARNTPPLQRTQ